MGMSQHTWQGNEFLKTLATFNYHTYGGQRTSHRTIVSLPLLPAWDWTQADSLGSKRLSSPIELFPGPRIFGFFFFFGLVLRLGERKCPNRRLGLTRSPLPSLGQVLWPSLQVPIRTDKIYVTFRSHCEEEMPFVRHKGTEKGKLCREGLGK